MISNKALIGLTLATSVLNVQAWWGTGHMLVARIAYDKINSADDSIMTRANDILTYLAPFTELEGDHPFVECATFADEIKSKGFDDQAHWHFVDTPFLDEGFQAVINPEPYNVTWAIGEMIKSLKFAKEDEEPVDTKPKPHKKSVNNTLGDSLNLRLLIHYVGDLHQPLHSVSRYTENYPTGDIGGNAFPLTPSG
jgi:hypothetical protein